MSDSLGPHGLQHTRPSCLSLPPRAYSNLCPLIGRCHPTISPSSFVFDLSLVAQKVKRLPTMGETQVRSLGWEDPLEKEMTTHSSILAWRIPWTQEPGKLWFIGLQRVGHHWAISLHFIFNLFQLQGLFQQFNLCIGWPKYWSNYDSTVVRC